MIAVVAVFVVAAFHYGKADDAVTAVSPAVGVIASLVGAYFGIRGATVVHAQTMRAMQERDRQL